MIFRKFGEPWEPYYKLPPLGPEAKVFAPTPGNYPLPLKPEPNSKGKPDGKHGFGVYAWVPKAPAPLIHTAFHQARRQLVGFVQRDDNSSEIPRGTPAPT